MTRRRSLHFCWLRLTKGDLEKVKEKDKYKKDQKFREAIDEAYDALSKAST